LDIVAFVLHPQSELPVRQNTSAATIGDFRALMAVLPALPG
jgi:hypothetical protein